MKNLLGILFLCLFASSCFAANLITWTGYGGNPFWGDPDNWDLQRLPEAYDDVIIPNGVDEVILDPTVVRIKSLEIGEESMCNVPKGHELRVEQSSLVGITVQNLAVLNNQGAIHLKQCGTFGILSHGLVYNEGSILVEAPGFMGIEVHGEMENAGMINIVEVRRSIKLHGDWHNQVGANLSIDGRVQLHSGTMQNAGEWEIAFDTNSGPVMEIWTTALLENRAQGSIDIGMTIQTTGVKFRFGGRVNNRGVFRIKGLDSALFGVGIDMSRGSWYNYASAQLEVSEFSRGIDVDDDFYNYGSIDIHTIRDNGIENGGSFYNSGNLHTEARLRTRSSGEWENDGGTITVATNGIKAIHHQGDFENLNCGRIVLEGHIDFVAGATFNNHAFLELGEMVAPFNGYPLDNYGTIYDPGEALSSFTNHSVHLRRIDEFYNPPCDDDFVNVFGLGNAVSVKFSKEFYETPNLNSNGVIGIYDESSNEAELALGYPYYYAAFTDAHQGCTQIYGLPAADCSSPFQQNTPSLASSSLAQSTPGQIKVFPNPTSGQIQIQGRSTTAKAPLNFRLTNALGQILWQGQLPTETTPQIELPATLNDGYYFLHIYNAQQVLQSEKIFLQRNLTTQN